MPPRRAPKVMRRPRRVARKSVKKTGTDGRQNRHLKALTQAHNLNAMVLRRMMNRSSHGFLQANEKESGNGAVNCDFYTGSHTFLGSTFTYGRLPLLMVNLTQMRNANPSGQRNGPGIFALQGPLSTRPFLSVEAQQVIQAQDGAGGINETSTNASFPHALCNWSSARLCLWGAKNRKVRWTLRLVSLKDEKLMPEFNDDGVYASTLGTLGGTSAYVYSRAFYNAFLKGKLSNPVHGFRDESRLQNEHRKDYKILWEKTYTINEQSADYDERPHRFVKIFRRINKVLDFWTPKLDDTFANLESADTPEVTQQDTSAYPFVDHSKNMYLMITCDSTLDQTTGGVTDLDGTFSGTRSDHSASFDIKTETMWSRYASM